MRQISLLKKPHNNGIAYSSLFIAHFPSIQPTIPIVSQSVSPQPPAVVVGINICRNSHSRFSFLSSRISSTAHTYDSATHTSTLFHSHLSNLTFAGRILTHYTPSSSYTFAFTAHHPTTPPHHHITPHITNPINHHASRKPSRPQSPPSPPLRPHPRLRRSSNIQTYVPSPSLPLPFPPSHPPPSTQPANKHPTQTP